MKPLAIGVFVVFVGYWMVESPQGFAGFTQDAVAWAWDMVQMLFTSVIDVLDTLFD